MELEFLVKVGVGAEDGVTALFTIGARAEDGADPFISLT
jgi:hypothetical protein